MEKAEYYYLRSISLAKTLNIPSTTAGALTNLGLLYYRQGNLEKAEE